MHKEVCGGLDRAIEQCRSANTVICLGSSLTVTPASDLPSFVENIVICNLQETDLDSHARVRVFAECDIFIKELYACIQLTKPWFF